MADAVRPCGSRWFGHLERESVDDWMPARRNVEVARVKCRR